MMRPESALSWRPESGTDVLWKPTGCSWLLGALAGRKQRYGVRQHPLADNWDPDMANFFDKALRSDPGPTERKSARKPWWQTTKTARQGFMMATLCAVLGLAALLASTVGWAHILVAAMVWLPMAGVYLVTAIALRRRERSAAQADHGSPPGLPPSS